MSGVFACLVLYMRLRPARIAPLQIPLMILLVFASGVVAGLIFYPCSSLLLSFLVWLLLLVLLVVLRWLLHVAFVGFFSYYLPCVFFVVLF